MFGVTVAIDNILSLLPTVLFPHSKTAKMLTLRMGVIFADYQTRHKMQKGTENRNFQCSSAFKFFGGAIQDSNLRAHDASRQASAAYPCGNAALE